MALDVHALDGPVLDNFEKKKTFTISVMWPTLCSSMHHDPSCICLLENLLVAVSF